MNLRSLVSLACASAAGLMLADACSADTGKAVTAAGDLMRDAGSIIRDGGQALSEAGTSMGDARDASAQSGRPPTKSGSRIQMRYAVQRGADGSIYAYQTAPYDLDRKEMCSPMAMTDGKTRCAPSAGAGLDRTLFSDSACTKYAIVIPQCSPVPKYLSEYVFGQEQCGRASTKLYSLGPQTSQVFLRSRPDVPCAPYVPPVGSQVFELGPEVSPSSFVEFAEIEYEPIE